jgi:histidinol-phosphate phosphatase family protein
LERHDRKSPAVFIDRDGTIIYERNYLRKIKDIKLFAFAVESMKLLKEHGYKLVIITNQSGIGRGYFSEARLKKIHLRLLEMLGRKGVKIDAVYYCPHLPDDGCECRKPKLALVRLAQRKLRLDLKRSCSIGDHMGDYLLGKNMGGKGLFVLTGHGREVLKMIDSPKTKVKPDFVAKNILVAAKWIVNNNP